ncbi:MAG: rRNA pseudouridine synthase [Firmicutes bacterium]|nr:rRNA pseudouridine synthase [Bacillota bacterium]
MPIRIQRILQQAGLASRRQAEEWIRAGRVAVNGQRAELGALADPEKDQITVDGRSIAVTERPLVYVALHKPPGYTTSLKDRHAERLISELIPPKFGRLFPVGRLDRDSEGLILLTNDGKLAHALMHPSSGIKKVYEVWVEGIPRKSHLERMRHGIELEDGPAKPDEVVLVRKSEGRALLRITLHEGRKREVRRIFDSIGHPVQQLTRTQFGNIRLEGLEAGRSRPLSNREVRELKELVHQGRERTGKRNAAIARGADTGRAEHYRREGVPAPRSGSPVRNAGRNPRRTDR